MWRASESLEIFGGPKAWLLLVRLKCFSVMSLNELVQCIKDYLVMTDSTPLLSSNPNNLLVYVLPRRLKHSSESPRVHSILDTKSF